MTAYLAQRSVRAEVGLLGGGLLTQNFGLENLTAVGASLTSGTCYGGRIGLRAGDIVRNVHIAVTQAGVGTAPTLFKFGVVSPSGVVLALTADQAASSQLTNLGVATFPLTSSLAITADGSYIPTALKVGEFAGTALKIGAQTLTDASLGTPVSGTALNGRYGTGLSDHAAVAASLASRLTTGACFWFGFS